MGELMYRYSRKKDWVWEGDLFLERKNKASLGVESAAAEERSWVGTGVKKRLHFRKFVRSMAYRARYFNVRR